MNLIEKLKTFNCDCTSIDDKAWELLTNSWLTPAEISRITGISQPTLHSYIRDRSRMLGASYKTLVKLAECYNEIVKEVRAVVK